MPFFDSIRIGAAGAADSAYTVSRSLRFNDNDSAYLARTPSSASNRKTWSLSFWFKRGHIANGDTNKRGNLFCSAGNNDATFFDARIRETDKLMIGINTQILLSTNQVFRDISAWYHIVISFDTTQSTASNRLKLYINGSEVTSFETDTRSSYVTQNGDFGINSTTELVFGKHGGNYNYFDGYLAEINFIDGLSLDPSYFGATDVLTGQWVPKKYTGSYGTNGFYLNFSDNSGTSATTLGKDSSGNGNNFTPNNFSVSAGAGNDSVSDTPTNNFCTFNPLKVNASNPIVFSEGNLQHNGISGNNHLRSATTMQVNSGKWYVEFKFVSGYEATNGTVRFGICTEAGHRDSNNDATWYQNTENFLAIQYGNNGTVYRSETGTNTSELTGLSTFVNGDVMGIALDLDNDKFFVSKNGTFFSNGTGTQDPAAGTNPLYSGGVLTTRKSDGFYFNIDGYSAQVVTADFGQQGYAYTPPSGFKKVNSANLPDPTILLPNKHFDTLLYVGNNGTQNVTGLNFNPDWVWGKNRQDAGYHHDLYDTVRGDNLRIFSSQNSAEATGYLQFGVTGGFTLTAGGGINNNAKNHVAWNWNAGDTDGKTYAVTVVSDSGNKYRFDGFGTSAVTLDLAEGGTYVFDWSDSSAQSHPIRFSTTADGTHGGGTEYTTGVVKDDSAYKTTITVAASAPTLYYYCQNHSGMGGQVNTNSTLGSSNFDGTIQSTAKVNATAGFSIVTYTGNGTGGATLGHGLGVTPQVTIIKNRTTSSRDWIVNHPNLTSGKVLFLNSTSSELTNGGGTPTTFTSTTIRLDSGSSGLLGINHSSDNYVMYTFSEVAGYSKFGSYVGNGSTDGPFVFTGFRPAWVMVKRSSASSASSGWLIYDNKRNTFNQVSNKLAANSNQEENDPNTIGTSGANDIDFLSNGFKPRATNAGTNVSGNTYIYLAFAESPFKNARAR